MEKEAKQRKENNFYAKVYRLVRRIPRGKVSTYGTIAKKIGTGLSSRMVGYALHVAAGSDVPCHRVVNRLGALTGAVHFGDPNLMRSLLEQEKVKFNTDGTVDMENHFYDFKPHAGKKRSTKS
ncbi:MAG: MGMT family protein [Rhizobacter sp.]|nr:MGMT family protein [Chlorobiales bacterium]